MAEKTQAEKYEEVKKMREQLQNAVMDWEQNGSIWRRSTGMGKVIAEVDPTCDGHQHANDAVVVLWHVHPKAGSGQCARDMVVVADVGSVHEAVTLAMAEANRYIDHLHLGQELRPSTHETKKRCPNCGCVLENEE